MLEAQPRVDRDSRQPASAASWWTEPRPLAFLLLTTIVFLACRLYWAYTWGLGADEAFTLRLVRQTWGHLLAGALEDRVHPPLYYMLLKGWMAIVGEGVFRLRLLSILLSVLAIPATCLLARELGLPLRTANLALLFASFNAFLVRFSQELRMYSLMVVLSLCSLWLFHQYVRSASRGGGPLLALVAVNVLLAYTHYLGWILIGLEGAYLLGKARPRVLPFLAGAVATAAAFAPWAYAVATSAPIVEGAVEHLAWNEPNTWRGIIIYFARLNGPYRDTLNMSAVKIAIGYVLLALPVAIAVLRAFRGRRDGRGEGFTLWWLIYFSVVPVFLVWALSAVLPVSIFGGRYLIFAAIPYLLLCAVGIMALPGSALRGAVVAAAVAFAALGFAQDVRLGHDVDWLDLVEQMRRAETERGPAGAGSVTVYVRGHAQPIRYGLEKAEDGRFRVESVDELEEMSGERFWLVYQESFWKENVTRAMEAALAPRGYVLEKDLTSGMPKHLGHISLYVRAGSPP
jgi:hypothetical protein